MKKEEIIEKLKDLGIESKNAYPKSSFIYEGDVCVGLYEREMKEAFYFFNKYDSKIYKYPFTGNYKDAFEYDSIAEKYMVPLAYCQVVWEDKPYVELPDAKFAEMTLRQYACIHLRIAQSGLDWLDNLIKETSPL
jgi:hypothetical protein